MKSPVLALARAYVDQGSPPAAARALASFTIELMDRSRDSRHGRYLLTRDDREKLLLLQSLASTTGEAFPSTKTAKLIECVYANGGVTWVETE